MVARFSTTTRSTSASASATSPFVGGVAASMASPGTSRSTGPSPATVRMVKPSSVREAAHASATIDTPSVPPRRNETMAQVDMMGP